MLTLRTLGGLRLENSSELPNARATQRRRLAVLALLSLAPERRLPRARLVAYLWPDISEEQARARLSTALYDLRQLLGDDAVISEGDEIRLVGSPIRVDVQELEDAARGGDWERARAAYGGPFLDGVYLSGAPAFEDWASVTRERLQRLHRAVLEQAAAAREATGDFAGAVDRLRELFALDPLDLRTTRRLMEALAANGDRTAAIRVADDSARLLRAELDAEPDPSIATLAEQLRAEPAIEERAAVTPPGSGAHAGESLGAHGDVRDAPAPLARSTAPVRRWSYGAAAMLLLLATAALARARRADAHAPAVPARHVLVMPFRVDGDRDTTVGSTFAGLLAASVDKTSGFSAAEAPSSAARESASRGVAQSLATRAQADVYVMGVITGTGSSVHVEADAFDSRSGAEDASWRGDVARGALPALASDFARRLVAAELRSPADGLARAAALSTTSVSAMRDFLVGERAFRAGRFREAVKSFQAATDADSTMALAHYRLSLATMWGNVPLASIDHHDSLALRYASTLPGEVRTLITSYGDWRRGNAPAARDAYLELTARDLAFVDAWHQLAETFFHYNPAVGRPIGESRAAFEQAVQLDSTHWGARWHLALLDGLEHGRDAFRARVRGLLALDPDSATALGVRLLAEGDSGEAKLASLARTADEYSLIEGAWRRSVYLHDLAGAADLYQHLAASPHNAFTRAQGLYGLAALELAHGRLAAATRLVLQPMPSWVRSDGLEALVVSAVTPTFEAPATTLDSLGAALEEWRARAGDQETYREGIVLRADYLEGLLAVAKGDSRQALDLARRLRGSGYLRRQADFTLRAFVLHRAGQDDAALAALDSARVVTWFGAAVSSPWDAQMFQRFLRAECLRALGRWQEAIGWYQSFEEYAPLDVALLGPATLGMADAWEHLGEKSEAAAAYSRFVALWSKSDARYHALVAGAATRVH